MLAWALAAGGGGAAAAAAWALFESQWVELAEVELPLPGLPPELDGLRILHLSDFHLGKRSMNGRAFEKAVAWAEARDADLNYPTVAHALNRVEGRE